MVFFLFLIFLLLNERRALHSCSCLKPHHCLPSSVPLGNPPTHHPKCCAVSLETSARLSPQWPRCCVMATKTRNCFLCIAASCSDMRVWARRPHLKDLHSCMKMIIWSALVLTCMFTFYRLSYHSQLWGLLVGKLVPFLKKILCSILDPALLLWN